MWTREEGEIALREGTPVAGEVTVAAGREAPTALTAAGVTAEAVAEMAGAERALIAGKVEEGCVTTARILVARVSVRTGWRRKNSSRTCLRT